MGTFGRSITSRCGCLPVTPALVSNKAFSTATFEPLATSVDSRSTLLRLADRSESCRHSMNFSDLSTGLLASVLHFLPSTDVKCIELSGSDELNSKIRDAVQEWRLEISALKPFPGWAFDYPNLQHLHVSSTAAGLKAPLRWSYGLPLPFEPHTALQSLSFDFVDSALVLSSGAGHRTLSSMCPNLTKLSCSSLGHFNPDWLHNLPPKLTHLRLAATPLTSIVSLHHTSLSTLPSTLESLELEGIFIDVKENVEIDWNPRLRHLSLLPGPSTLLTNLPKALESLSISWKDVRPHLRALSARLLPPTLRRLALTDALLGKFILDSPLPPNMTQLYFSECTFWRSMDAKIDKSNSSEVTSFFGDSLTDVRLSNIDPSHIALLPIFAQLKELVVDSKLAAKLLAPQSSLRFPSKLTSLIMSESAPSPDLIKLLPTTVQRIKASIRDTAQCDALAKLSSLRHLHILKDYRSASLPATFWKRVCPMLETLITPLSKSLEPPRDSKQLFMSNSSFSPSSPSSPSNNSVQPAKEWALLGSRLKTLELVLSARTAAQYRPEMVMRMLPTGITSLALTIERPRNKPQPPQKAPNASEIEYGTMDDEDIESSSSDQEFLPPSPYDTINGDYDEQEESFAAESDPDWFMYFARFVNLQTLLIRDTRPASAESLEYPESQRPFLTRLPVSLRKLQLELPHLPVDALYSLPHHLESLTIKKSTATQGADKSFVLTGEHLAYLPLNLVELRLDCPHEPLSSFVEELPKTIVSLQDGPIAYTGAASSPALREALAERKALKRELKREKEANGSLEDANYDEEEEDGEEIIEEETASSGEAFSNDGSHLDEQDFANLMSDEETQQFYEEQREALRQSQAIAKAMALGLPHPMPPLSPTIRSPTSPPPSGVLRGSQQISPVSVATPVSPPSSDRWERNSLPWDQLHKNLEQATLNAPEVDIDSDIEDHLLEDETEYEGFYLLPRSPPFQVHLNSRTMASQKLNGAQEPEKLNQSSISPAASSPQPSEQSSASDSEEGELKRSSISSISSDGFELI